MIRLAAVLLIASAYFSPAHAIGVEIGHDAARSVIDRTASPGATGRAPGLSAEAMPAHAMPRPASSVAAAKEERSVVLAKLPLPSSLWFFIAALIAGFVLIRRRVDTA